MSYGTLPEMSDQERDEGQAKSVKFIAVASLLTVFIGFGLALLIYFFTGNKADYDAKIDLVQGHDLHWMYLSAFIFCRLVNWVNSYPMIYKSRVMKGDAGNLRSNMYLFRSQGQNSLVVLDSEGDAGMYNRANRSLHHFTEYAASVVVSLVLCSVCFPVATFVLILIFTIGRILYALGYTNGGYGSHGRGFMLCMIATSTLEGLLLCVAVKGFGWL